MLARRRLRAGIVPFAVALLLAGCGVSPDDVGEALVGRWESAEPEDSGTVEFERDGRFVLRDPSGGTVAGSWAPTAAGAVTMTITHSDILRDRLEPVEGETFVVEATVEGSTLRLTMDGESEVYRRAPDGR